MESVFLLALVGAGVWACWHWFLSDWLETKGVLRSIRGRKAANKISDEAYFEQVAAELNGGTLRQGLWAQALAQSDGDQVKARAVYMKLRVASMKAEVARRFSEAADDTNQEKVVIPCPQCQTGLRLPANKSMDVRCPRCDHRFRTSTTQDFETELASESSRLVGRIGRLSFFKWQVLQFVLGIGLTIYVESQKVPISLGVAIFIIAISVLWWAAVMQARLQDANKSLWLMVFGFIPVVNLLLSFYLLVVPGSKGSNKYGPPDTGLLRG